MRRLLPALLFLLLLCASLRLCGEVFCHYDDQGRRQFEDRYDSYDYDTDGGHTGYGTIGGNYSGTYYSYNEPVAVKLHDGVSPVRAYTLTASSTGNTGNLSVPAEDWLRGSDWGGGIGGVLYSQPEYGNATTAKYYNYDGRGDVVALTSNTGNITYAAAYNAYGQHATVTSGNVTTTGTQEVGTDTDLFRLTTKEEDPWGASYQINRYVSLTDNNWLSRDPLGLVNGPNPYTYVEQNNWTKTDPLGLQDPAPSPGATLQLLPLIAVGLIGSAIVWQDITHGFHPSSTPSSDQSPAPTITTTQPPPTATPPGGQVPKPTTATPGSTAPAIPNNTGGTPAAPLPNATPGGSTTPLPVTTPGQPVTPSGTAQTPDIMNSVIQGKATTDTPSGGAGPVPERITNPKHNPNSTSPEPANVDDLYKNSVVDENGVRWAKDADGTIHRFSKPSNGQSHWNGSTAGSDPIQEQNIPNNVKKQLDSNN